MTSAKSTFSYCGAGLEAALEVTCSGPACDALQGFPDLTCTTSGNGLNCTNGVKCDTDLWITELDFEVPDTTNPRIQQNHTTTIPECDYKFQVTDDGTTAGFQFQNLTAGNAKCNTPVGQEFNLTSTNSTGGSNNTATHTPKASNASRNVKSPFFILFVLVTLIMPSLASYVETRGITPAKPPASLFPDTNICVKYGFKTPTTDLKKRELAVQDLEKRMTELAVLHDRGLGDTLYELTAKFPSFWDRLFDYIGAKLWGKVHNPSGDVFKTCWQGELTSTVCATAIGMSIPALPMLGIVGELVPACMSVINGLAVLDMEPLTKFGLFMGSGIFCNWLVAEALPMIPCLQELICDRVMPKLLPESKCQGPPPNTDAVPLPLKPMTAPEYMSDGGLLKNPNKCGSFFTPVSQPPWITKTGHLMEVSATPTNAKTQHAPRPPVWARHARRSIPVVLATAVCVARSLTVPLVSACMDLRLVKG